MKKYIFRKELFIKSFNKCTQGLPLFDLEFNLSTWVKDCDGKEFAYKNGKLTYGIYEAHVDWCEVIETDD